jgi:EmrB/QacA subfamily drug resistance transporter
MFEAAVPASVRPPCRPPESEPRWALVVATLGSSMAFLDGTVVNVALPVMQRELGVGVELVQWVVEAYALFLASLVLVGGALGDRLGRRRVFSAGATVFAVASVACGLAPSALSLVFARAVQGIGGALLVPGSLALISAAYPDEKARGVAIGTWSAWSSIMSAAGPIAGGWVVEHASWRWLFLFNVPVAVVVVALTTLRVAETRDEMATQKMDWLGASFATVGLGAVVYALIDSENAGGLSSIGVFALFAAGVVLLAAFVVAELRGSAPMVPPALFSSRAFLGTNVLTFFLYAALGGALFFVPFNLIQLQGYRPSAAGAALLPFVALISVMSRWVGGMTEKWGTRIPLIAGPSIAGLGLALLALPDVGGAYWTTFFPGIFVLGVGMGLTVAPLTTTVMSSVERRHAGVASGVNNAISRAAGLLAVAALGSLLVMRFNQALSHEIGALSLPADVAMAVEAQRGRLTAPELSAALDPVLAGAVREAFARSYVTAFRTLMIAGSVLAVSAALAAVVFVDAKIDRRAAE